jgi:malonate-semialdehyde dehydrogenase (acetylating) / methylmalonate-semialdehyde dehydrogenase
MSLVELRSDPVVCKNFIAGNWTEASPSQLDVESPYTGKVIGSVSLSSKQELDTAVKSAKDAFEGWSQIPIKERTQFLFNYKSLLEKNIDAVANCAASEAGKTVAEAKAGVLKGIEVVEFALSLQNMSLGSNLEVSRGVQCQARRIPLGVVAGITPFNFPAMVPMWLFPIAITLGNTFILKPSEKVPLTSMMIADLMNQAGYPKGVFNVVYGDKDVVGEICDHADIKAVAFVGSTKIARLVYQRANQTDKRALCLGGAKNHLILVPDADEDVAVPGIVDSFTGCAGQRCMAASLMVAVGDVGHIIEKIKDHAAKMKLGTGMGAIIDKASYTRILEGIAAAERDGAKIILDGRKSTPPKGYEGGYWIGPTIIDHATAQMDCATQELFGPVLTIVRTKTLTEALDMDRHNPYGNATSVFTTNGQVAEIVASQASSGMIGINIGVPVPREPFSFGGINDSKFGQGDITGSASLDFWSNWRKVTTKWKTQTDHNWMS